MRKENTIIALSIFTFLTPFLGVPGSLKTLLTLIFAFLICVTGLMVRSDFKRLAATKGKHTDAFVENGTGGSHHG